MFGVGQIAVGYVAIGQIGFGVYALAQEGFGRYVWNSNRTDIEAVDFFRELARRIGCNIR